MDPSQYSQDFSQSFHVTEGFVFIKRERLKFSTKSYIIHSKYNLDYIRTKNKTKDVQDHDGIGSGFWQITQVIQSVRNTGRFWRIKMLIYEISIVIQTIINQFRCAPIEFYGIISRVLNGNVFVLKKLLTLQLHETCLDSQQEIICRRWWWNVSLNKYVYID